MGASSGRRARRRAGAPHALAAARAVRAARDRPIRGIDLRRGSADAAPEGWEPHMSRSAGKAEPGATEQGFGTGLRAQLARRREGEGEPGSEVLLEPGTAGVADGDELRVLRMELEGALAREQALRAELEVGGNAAPDLSALEQRLSETQALERALDERERRLMEELNAFEARQIELTERERELGAVEARRTGADAQLEARMSELAHLEAAHTAAETELIARGDALVAAEAEVEKRRGSLEAQIESELARRTAELDGRAKDIDKREA